MSAERRFVVGTLLLGGAALAHAALTWSVRPTIVLFGGCAVVAFLAEALVVRLGLLRHRVRPQVAGVPLVVLLAWPATVYVSYRAATFVLPPGVAAAALAAVAATLFDAATDPIGVAAGHWAYPESPLSRPRFRGVPWWNFAGWLVVVFVTALLPGVVG